MTIKDRTIHNRTIRDRTINAVLSTALTLSIATGAGAETTESFERSSPVKVTSCKVISQQVSSEIDRAGDVVAGRLWFGIINQWPEPATEVRFRVHYGTLQATVVETGTFSQNARIERTSDVTVFAPWVGTDPQACTVVSVKFANGTAWMPPPDVRSSTLPRERGVN